MNNSIILNSTSRDGSPLEVIFDPSKGMNFLSYKKGSIQVIDQMTRALFEERYAGLGAMIGPHFHHRPQNEIVPLRDPSLFPHVQKVFAKGVKEPFSHGIGRYAPWKAISTSDSISATLNGKDTWRGIPLSDLEGQDFTMTYKAELSSDGLHLHLTVESEKPSVVGLHTYYSLGKEKGVVEAEISEYYNDHGILKQIPKNWPVQDHILKYRFDYEMDFGLYPREKNQGTVHLTTGDYQLHIHYKTTSEENSWQLWHPVGQTFVCLEPLSAKIPSKPTLTSSSLEVLIQII